MEFILKLLTRGIEKGFIWVNIEKSINLLNALHHLIFLWFMSINVLNTSNHVIFLWFMTGSVANCLE